MVERDTVENWLQQAGIEPLPGEEAIETPGPAFRWALQFDGGSYNTVVVHRDVNWNWLVMQVAVGVAPNHQDAIRQLPDDVRAEFVFDLRIALLQQPVGQKMSLAEDETDVPEGITIGLHVMEDPLQRSGFFRRNHQLQSAAVLGVQMIRKVATLGRW